MEREVGGGIGMGNTCKPMAVSFQCMTKSTRKKKKKETLGVTGKFGLGVQNEAVQRLIDLSQEKALS